MGVPEWDLHPKWGKCDDSQESERSPSLPGRVAESGPAAPGAGRSLLRRLVADSSLAAFAFFHFCWRVCWLGWDRPGVALLR